MKNIFNFSNFEKAIVSQCNRTKIILIIVLTFTTASLKSQQATYPNYKSTNFIKNITRVEKGHDSDSVIRHKLNTGMFSRDINFYFIVGLSFDKDYSNYINEAFESNGNSLSGFTGWINLGVGLEFKITNNFLLSPSITGRFSRIGVTDAFTNATTVRYINALYSIGLGGAFYVPVGKSSFFINTKKCHSSSSDVKKYLLEIQKIIFIKNFKI